MRVDEIIFEPLATKKQIEEGKKWLVDHKSVVSSAGVASFLVLGEYGRASYMNAGCHGALGNTTVDDRVLVATSNGYSVNRKKSGGLDKSVIEPFLKWFLYDSYMGRFILNRDDFEFCRDYGFIVSADVYAPLMQNVCITTRHFVECTEAAFLWFNKLVSGGIDPNLAYIVCFCSCLSSTDNIPLDSVIVNKGAHRAHRLFSLKDLNNFLNGDFGTVSEISNDKTQHYRNRKDYRGGYVLFTSPGEYTTNGIFPKGLLSLYKTFQERLAEFRNKSTDAKTYKVPNPFIRSYERHPKPQAVDDFSYTEVLEMVLPYMMENMKTWRS